MGGKYVEGNVVSVEVTACDKQTANHVMWHYANWCLWGREEDKLAWSGLAGFLGKEEIVQEKQKLGAKLGGRKNKESGHIKNLGETYGKKAMSPGGWLYENRHEYGTRGGMAATITGVGIHAMSREEKSEAGRLGGQRGGQKGGNTNKENKTGVCGIPPEEHSKRMSSTNKQKWVCPECGYVSNARRVNRHMGEEHNLPKEAKQKMVG
jgi:hypothetical protein